MTKDGIKRISEEEEKLLEEAVCALPDSYEDAMSKAHELHDAFHSRLGKQVEETLNSFFTNSPKETLVQKKDLASRINRDLRDVGLAIRCPVTGKPAILVAMTKEGPDEGGRFRIERREDDGRRTRSAVSQEDLRLEVVPSVAYRGGRKLDLEGGTAR